MAEVLRGITNLRNTLDMKHDKYVTFMIVAHARKQAGEQSLTERDFRIIPSHILGATTIPSWYEIAFTMSPKINSKTKNGYSVMKVFARNFAFNNEILWGYVGSAFTSIDQNKKGPDSELVEKVKAETPIETTKESAQAFLDLAKEQGKVIEND